MWYFATLHYLIGVEVIKMQAGLRQSVPLSLVGIQIMTDRFFFFLII